MKRWRRRRQARDASCPLEACEKCESCSSGTLTPVSCPATWTNCSCSTNWRSWWDGTSCPPSDHTPPSSVSSAGMTSPSQNSCSTSSIRRRQVSIATTISCPCTTSAVSANNTTTTSATWRRWRKTSHTCWARWVHQSTTLKTTTNTS